LGLDDAELRALAASGAIADISLPGPQRVEDVSTV
jgi:hypothetical protein